MGRIPTAMTLSKRGIKISSISCQICSNGVDIADHILLECPDAVDSLVWIFIWCGIPFQRFRLISDFVNFAVIWGKCSKNRKIFIAIRYGFLWCMWKTMNDVWFKDVRVNSIKLVDNVLSVVFSWMKHRSNFENCKWEFWNCSPFDIL